jgi:hypothetical protein
MYLRQQSMLAGHEVTARDLVPLEELASWKSRLREIDKTSRTKFKQAPEFDAYVKRLEELNPSSVYLCTPLASICGPATVGSIADVDFGFPFSFNVEGVVSFISTNFTDELLLDYDEEQGQQLLGIEARSARWPHCDFAASREDSS